MAPKNKANSPKIPSLLPVLAVFLNFLNPKNSTIKQSKMMKINFLKNNNAG